MPKYQGMYTGMHALAFDYIAAKQLLTEKPALFNDIATNFDNNGTASVAINYAIVNGDVEMLSSYEPREDTVNCTAFRLTEQGRNIAKNLSRNYLQDLLD